MTTSSYDVMGGYLQRHAYQNVWCTPTQDKQTIFKPHRLSPNGGAWIDFKVMWRLINLPDKKSHFHIYQIGQLHPLILGLKDVQNVWIKMSEAMITKRMLADFYTVDGVQIHRTQVWYRVTQDKDLIIAIKLPDQKRLPINLETQDIYMRLYTNAYFSSPRANDANDVIYIQGIQAVTTQDILDIQNSITTYRSKSIGYVTCYLNGFRVDTIDLVNAVIGDYIEFVYDGSVKRVVIFNISDLQQFISLLDSNSKYLLHYPGNVGEIEYHDDVDFFLVKPGNLTGRYKGLYYHKNNSEAVRMVTHQDYSVPVQYLMSYAQAHPELGTIDQMQLIVQIKNSGYARPLINESSRILDLYKLSEADLIAAMVGVNSTVAVWTAPNLENSDYCALMRAELGAISTETVQEAYGYNAVSKLIGDTPQYSVLSSNAQRIEIPSALADSCTVYEYGGDGLLIGWYPHNSGSAYECVNSTTQLCEVISGIADLGLDSYWNIPTHAIDLNTNYRFYLCGMVDGIIDDIWQDVTNSDQYSILNGVVTWLIDHDAKYTLVRPNSKHITYSLDYAAVDSFISFSLREYRSDISAYRELKIPLGELDIFLNGKSLIEKIDYIVDFPRVTICNKEYLINPDSQNQKIVIRFTNFCQSDLNRTPLNEVGFVQYGTLSFNNRYDIREDKVNRIIIEGSLYRWDELEFAEGDFDIHVTDVKNGFPYSIRDIIIPMNDYLAPETNQKVDPTYTLRAIDLITDKAISDYMTLKIPQKAPSNPSAIVALYRIVSPFFSHIVYDLISGALWDPIFTQQYSDDYVRQMCQRYEYILAWDPITDENLPDLNFCIIEPHNLNHYVDMGIYQYKFLTRVQRIYCPDRISLSGSIRVAQF